MKTPTPLPTQLSVPHLLPPLPPPPPLPPVVELDADDNDVNLVGSSAPSTRPSTRPPTMPPSPRAHASAAGLTGGKPNAAAVASFARRVEQKLQQKRAEVTAAKSPNTSKVLKAHLSDDEEVIMLTEVRAARAHVPQPGKMFKAFEQAASKLNANPAFGVKVNGRSLCDRFKKRMALFVTERGEDVNASGRGGEYTQVEKILEDIRSAQDAMKLIKAQQYAKADSQREKKEAAGRRVLASAVGEAVANGDEEEGGESEPEKSQRGPKRRRLDCGVVDVDTGLEAFGESIEKTEIARVSLEERQLAFQEKVYEDMVRERQADNADRAAQEAARDEREQRKTEAFMKFSMQAIAATVREILHKQPTRSD